MLFSAYGMTQDVISYVDPFIGTGGHGHTFPGATVPFGMMQLSPDTRLTGWDGCSGYHYTDSVVYGFSHTHLSGTGVSDYGDLLLMPVTGATNFHNGHDGKEGYGSPFKKENENASPGYYSTILDKYDIKIALTTTARAGMHEYIYPAQQDRKLIIDLEHRDKVIDSGITIVSDTEVEGYRHSNAWATEQRFYYVMQFDQPIINHEILSSGVANNSFKSAKGTAIKAMLDFGQADKILKVRVGISSVDIDGARQNLKAEINHWDFDRTLAEAEQLWTKELSKIKVTDEDKEKKTIFYTALYHTMIAPNIFSDVDGRYLGTDLNIHQTDGYNHYTIFSLWDTYRALHPLATIIDQKRTKDYIHTFMSQYQQGGQLPMWELGANYTGCMIGYHATPVISDAYMKGITGYNEDLALDAMIHSATADRLGIQEYIENGFLSTAQEAESVSKSLEYAYDDWTIAKMAEKMGRNNIAAEYYRRAQYYKNLFDPSTQHMRARSNNRWFFPFDPTEVNFNYTEANSWQYSFSVAQDIEGWTTLMGGEEKGISKLDALFSAPEQTSGRHQADITGLIGQYAHGNEPSHHIAYLYNYLGQPYKTQKYVRQIMDDLYAAAPNGLSGNEDCGQMSAWLVFSAMGFYPVAPGSNDYIIGSPWFDEVEIFLENGNSVLLQTENNSDENIYIENIYEGEGSYTKTYISHELLMEGPSFYFVMSNTPNAQFGQEKSDRPISRIVDNELVTVPAIVRGDRSFRHQTEVELATATPGTTIYYTLNDDEPKQYEGPITIKSHSYLTTWAEKPGAYPSKKATSLFSKMDTDKRITLETVYAPQYAAGGDEALIDQLRGGKDFRNGTWQGYEGVDAVAIIDLGNNKTFSEVRMGFLQDENSWIFMPTDLEVYIGEPGQWNLLGSLHNNIIKTTDKGSIVKDFVVRNEAQSRYVKVVGKTLGACPSHHKGAGHKCWVFADEIIIK